MGGVLCGVSEQDCEDLYRSYLHDFVRIVHMCKHSKNLEHEDKEYEVRCTIYSYRQSHRARGVGEWSCQRVTL